MSILPELRLDKPVASASGFGRVFWGGGSTVYYSPVVDSISDLGKCYQIADPTSDDISDPLATDGGRILLKDAGTIIDLYTYNSGVLIFTDKGVWYIYNNETGFSNSAFSVRKITDEALVAKGSIVEANGVVYYGTVSSLNSITPNENNFLVSQSITDMVIRSYYIENFTEGFKASYDNKTKNIWFISNQSEPVKDLVYNVLAQAFYPQDFNATPKTIVAPLKIGTDVYFTVVEGDGTTEITYNVAELSDITFKDLGVDMEAYLLSGYETLGKFSHKKGIAQATFYMNKTETEITGYDETTDTYIFDLPSSCTVQVRWDFDNSNAFNRWVGDSSTVSTNSGSLNIYSPMVRGFTPSTDAFPVTFDTGEKLIKRKTKLRGRGDAVQFYFEAEPEKDLQLLGYSVEYKMRGRQ
jgi:hypothetical protein